MAMASPSMRWVFGGIMESYGVFGAGKDYPVKRLDIQVLGPVVQILINGFTFGLSLMGHLDELGSNWR